MDHCGRAFEKLFLAVNNAQALLDLRFRWEPFPALTGALEKRARRDVRWILPYSLLVE
jgi:hypothetical protein